MNHFSTAFINVMLILTFTIIYFFKSNVVFVNIS